MTPGETPRLYRCTHHGCSKPIVKGAIFQDGKISVATTLMLLHNWLLRNTHKALCIQTGVGKNTVTRKLRDFRQLVGTILKQMDLSVGGLELQSPKRISLDIRSMEWLWD